MICLDLYQFSGQARPLLYSEISSEVNCQSRTIKFPQSSLSVFSQSNLTTLEYIEIPVIFMQYMYNYLCFILDKYL